MILVDTSVWIDHLRRANPTLTELLDSGGALVCGHAWVTGELALGSIANRAEVLTYLGKLPQAVIATPAEILHLVESAELHSLGIGFVDAQLLASARLGGDLLWTRDKRLLQCATRLGVAFEP